MVHGVLIFSSLSGSCFFYQTRTPDFGLPPGTPGLRAADEATQALSLSGLFYALGLNALAAVSPQPATAAAGTGDGPPAGASGTEADQAGLRSWTINGTTLQFATSSEHGCTVVLSCPTAIRAHVSRSFADLTLATFCEKYAPKLAEARAGGGAGAPGPKKFRGFAAVFTQLLLRLPDIQAQLLLEELDEPPGSWLFAAQANQFLDDLDSSALARGAASQQGWRSDRAATRAGTQRGRRRAFSICRRNEVVPSGDELPPGVSAGPGGASALGPFQFTYLLAGGAAAPAGSQAASAAEVADAVAAAVRGAAWLLGSLGESADTLRVMEVSVGSDGGRVRILRLGPFLLALPTAPGPEPAAKGAQRFRPDPLALLRPSLRGNLESLAAALSAVASWVAPDAVQTASPPQQPPAAAGAGAGSAAAGGGKAAGVGERLGVASAGLAPQQPPVGRAILVDRGAVLARRTRK